MAETNDASVCPVGRVWHYLRDNHNEIELYMPDESHPTLAGSYAAACAFYTMLFGRDPDSITYDADLSLKMAHLIRSAVHEVVFDSLWKWQRPEPNALLSVPIRPITRWHSVCPKGPKQKCFFSAQKEESFGENRPMARLAFL